MVTGEGSQGSPQGDVLSTGRPCGFLRVGAVGAGVEEEV